MGGLSESNQVWAIIEQAGRDERDRMKLKVLREQPQVVRTIILVIRIIIIV